MKLTDLASNPKCHYDNTNGMGAVPHNQEVDYMGVEVQMKPSVFLHLATFVPREELTSVDHIKKPLQEGKKIGTPFLMLMPTDDEDVWRVQSHEGRNRMYALYEMYGDIPLPVHLFPNNGMRARHITADVLKKWKSKLISESGTPIIGPLFKKH